MADGFTPTHEWQYVPKDVAIPGGLEIKMDINKGGRWARLPRGSESSDDMPVVAPISFTTSELAALQEKAHDYDDGAEIAQQYGYSLYNTFKDKKDKNSDQAGLVLSICLRNNKDAALAIASACSDLPETLTLDRRSLSILSALVSTNQGLHFAKERQGIAHMRRLLAGTTSPLDGAALTALSNLLEDLAIAGEDGDDMCSWVAALQQAYYSTGSPKLKQLAIDIVEHNNIFEVLKAQCVPQPGLLPVAEERKRAVETESRLPNPKAARNHFDEI